MRLFFFFSFPLAFWLSSHSDLKKLQTRWKALLFVAFKCIMEVETKKAVTVTMGIPTSLDAAKEMRRVFLKLSATDGRLTVALIAHFLRRPVHSRTRRWLPGSVEPTGFDHESDSGRSKNPSIGRLRLARLVQQDLQDGRQG